MRELVVIAILFVVMVSSGVALVCATAPMEAHNGR